MAAARPARLALQISQCRLDRPLVRLKQRRSRGLIGDREQHANGLRSRERQIERRNGRARAHRTQDRPIDRISAAHQRHELVAFNLSTQPENASATPAPQARSLAPTGIVVLDSRRDLLLVVLQPLAARAQLADRQHKRPPVRRGHKTDTSDRQTAVTADQTDPDQTGAFAGQKRPRRAARGRPYPLSSA